MTRRFAESDPGEFPGAYRPDQNVLALMPDGQTWWLAEIYQVRHSKYFDESDEDEEPEEFYHEEFREYPEQKDDDGHPIVYRETYDMHDISVMHPCWQEQSKIISKKESDNHERGRQFN